MSAKPSKKQEEAYQRVRHAMSEAFFQGMADMPMEGDSLYFSDMLDEMGGAPNVIYSAYQQGHKLRIQCEAAK